MIELTEFQYRSLKDAFDSNLKKYILLKPNAILDSPFVFTQWTRNNKDYLLPLGRVQTLRR